MANTGVKLALAAAVAAGLGIIGVTVFVGAKVREDTVVAQPYEDGLRHDAERRSRAELGLAVELPDGPPEAGAAPLVFGLADAAGGPVDDAAVTVEASRPETSRGALSAPGRPLGGGRWAAALSLPEPGAWDLRFDVRRGEDRVRLERRISARAACDLALGPCTRPLPGGGEVTVELSPRPPRPMRALAVRIEVREGGAPVAGAEVSARFSMPGMDMGENRSALAAAGPGRYEGGAVLVRCPSGRRAWVADVAVSRPGAPERTARFAVTAAE